MEVYLAVLDKAVVHHAVAHQLSSQASHTVSRTLCGECAVLDAQILHSTDDIVEESHRLTLIVAHGQVLDDMTTAVVVTFKARGTGSDGYYQRVGHVDVGSLPDIEIAALHRSNGYDELLQIGWRFYPIGVCRSATAFFA